MFEKLITNLKMSLPAPIRKKMGLDAESEGDSDELQSSEESDDQNDVGSEKTPDEDSKKKRNSMILRVVIIIGLGYYALDEFVLKKEQSVDEMVAKAPKKRRAKPVVAKTADATATAGTAATNETAPTTETAEATASASDSATTPPIENVNVIDKTETTVATESEETPKNVDAAIDSIETKVEEKVITPTATTPAVAEAPAVEEPVATSLESSLEEVNIPSQPQVEAKTPAKQKNKTESMASKISEDVNETPPPAYDQLGRGLVYNCKDKYWACLNKPAYVVCNKNMKWNQSKGNPAECVVQDIYNTDEDCAKIQKYNVSTSLSTAFCSN